MVGLAWAASLCAQHHFSYQEACYKNFSLPYCQGNDFGIKPVKGKNGATGSGVAGPLASFIDASGIDWRFADPSADTLAVLDCSHLSSSPLAHDLIDRLAANQGLSPADVQNLFQGLSVVGQVALSIREDRIVLMVTGRSPDSILPAPGAGWKSTPLESKALLIGNADAVDQAAQRISAAAPLGELPGLALARPVGSEFWAIGSAKLAGQEAAGAGVKRFSLTASMRDRLASDTAFEFDGAPDATAIQTWLKSLPDAKIEGNAIHQRMSMETGETEQSFSKIAASPMGQRLAAFIKSARYLPVRDTATTVHAKPVIYGLDDGAREVQHYVPSASDSSTSTAPTSSAPTSNTPVSASAARPATNLSGTWGFTHFDGRFQGVIVLQQTGSSITGTWHTSAGKSEPDSSLAGWVNGNTVTLTRVVGNNQNYVLTLSTDGTRLDGFGDGWFLNHTNLNMQRAAR
jgi:hypothetical protein